MGLTLNPYDPRNPAPESRVPLPAPAGWAALYEPDRAVVRVWPRPYRKANVTAVPAGSQDEAARFVRAFFGGQELQDRPPEVHSFVGPPPAAEPHTPPGPSPEDLAAAAEAMGWLQLTRPPTTAEEIERAFVAMARIFHPDHGGSGEAMAKLIEAREYLLARVKKQPPKPAGATPLLRQNGGAAEDETCPPGTPPRSDVGSSSANESQDSPPDSPTASKS